MRVLRRAWWIGVAVLVLTGGCAEQKNGFATVSSSTREAAPSPVQLRVLTYNIHHGLGMDKRIDLARIADVIRRAEPDLVALQEVDVGTKRSGGVDEAMELARITGMQPAFGKAMDYDGGQYGEAVLSRFPIERMRVHPLPHAPDHEPRCALEVRVRLAGTRATGRGGQLLFLATHWDHLKDPAERIQQAKAIAELVAGEPGPVVLAGDLNTTPGSEPLAALGPGWLDTASIDPAPSFPSGKPDIRIDYIMARPADRWRVISTRVVEESVASDHRPVTAVLELRMSVEREDR